MKVARTKSRITRLLYEPNVLMYEQLKLLKVSRSYFAQNQETKIQETVLMLNQHFIESNCKCLF